MRAGGFDCAAKKWGLARSGYSTMRSFVQILPAFTMPVSPFEHFSMGTAEG
jgi:hypothetical protein